MLSSASCLILLQEIAGRFVVREIGLARIAKAKCKRAAERGGGTPFRAAAGNARSVAAFLDRELLEGVIDGLRHVLVEVLAELLADLRAVDQLAGVAVDGVDRERTLDVSARPVVVVVATGDVEIRSSVRIPPVIDRVAVEAPGDDLGALGVAAGDADEQSGRPSLGSSPRAISSRETARRMRSSASVFCSSTAPPAPTSVPTTTWNVRYRLKSAWRSKSTRVWAAAGSAGSRAREESKAI